MTSFLRSLRGLLGLAVGLIAADRGHSAMLFEQVRQEYRAKGVELAVGDEPFPVMLENGSIQGRNVPAQDIELFLYIFRKEYGRYPAELFPLARLKRIVFCRDLAFAGQPRAVVPDREHDTLYLDVRAGIYSETYRRKVMHHDFYHLIDAVDNRVIGKDPEWEKLNPPGRHYGGGGAHAQGDKLGGVISHPAPGFLDTYAMSAVEEDKAEVFANLMVNDLKARLLFKEDSILQQKVALLKQQLAAFCPQLDEAFWARVAKGF